MRRLTLMLTLGTALAGCTVGPNYHRPAPAEAPAPQFHEVAGWMQATPADSLPKGDWWTALGDPLIDQLEPQVRVANQTVRADYANYQQALAIVGEANATLFPTLGATASATRARTSASTAKGPVASVGNQFSVEGNASWSPDIWGKVRRQIESDVASAQSSEATLANATLSAQVTLATTVINLRVADANIDLLKQTVAAYDDYLKVVASSVQTGYKLYSPLDEANARTQLQTAQSNLLNAGIARAQYVHAIAVLVGKNPEDIDIPHSTSLPSLPAVPVGVPSALLQRRPDIAAAERTMAAQNALIGVAVAAYYPDISLTGAIGSGASAVSQLFKAATSIWSVGASASETLIDFGARKSAVAQARAAYDAAVANYRGTVLSAFQGVEDNLVSLRVLSDQAGVLDKAIGSAAHASDVAHSEYQIGTVDYTAVADAALTEIATRQTALSVQQSRLVASVSLIGNLGGGWSADQLHNARHLSPAKAPGGPN
ncbi:efflux transporter outer membrane subunit [Novosphingobium sp. FSW06-99]|uniref:efflux transporter outer membrane subunit n=1 Tax=Novosphingobium sp. FSW06-99 TaxID=1739113 RepID=UPI000AD3D3E8|nr:efflux transporter outer membrane subunit [Novosphingobium sp. FSW06-99]